MGPTVEGRGRSGGLARLRETEEGGGGECRCCCCGFVVGRKEEIIDLSSGCRSGLLAKRFQSARYRVFFENSFLFGANNYGKELGHLKKVPQNFPPSSSSLKKEKEKAISTIFLGREKEKRKREEEEESWNK